MCEDERRQTEQKTKRKKVNIGYKLDREAGSELGSSQQRNQFGAVCYERRGGQARS